MDGLFKYFSESGRYRDLAVFLEEFIEREPEVGVLVAKCYIEDDDEIHGVKVLYDCLQKRPYSWGLLLVQIDFMIKKVLQLLLYLSLI